MLQRPAIVRLMPLSFVLVAFTSCASPPMKVDAPPSTRKTNHSASASQVQGSEDKDSSESRKDEDCIISAGAIHLWCKRVSRYY